MALRVMKKGRDWLVNLANGSSPSTGLTLHLFKSNITPSQDDTNATYTGAEANYTGYASQALTGLGAPTTDGEHEVTTGAAKTFTVGPTPSTTNSVYGYYVTQTSTGDILWAERFASAPLNMINPGDTIIVTPAFSIASEFA